MLGFGGGGDRGKFLILLILIGVLGLGLSPSLFLGGEEDNPLHTDFKIYTIQVDEDTTTLRNPGSFRLIPKDEAKLKPGEFLVINPEYKMEEYREGTIAFVFEASLKVEYDKSLDIDKEAIHQDPETQNPRNVESDKWLSLEISRRWSFEELEFLLESGTHKLKIKSTVELEEKNLDDSDSKTSKAEKTLEIQIQFLEDLREAVIKIA